MEESLYRALRGMARARLRAERPDHTLDPTALVHEAWLRMRTHIEAETMDPVRLRALGGRVLQRTLIDHARKRDAAKRGGGRVQRELTDSIVVPGGEAVDFAELHGALGRLSRMDARQARIVELRYFAGLSIEETAQLLQVSRDTVVRDWRFARAWLHAELARKESAE